MRNDDYKASPEAYISSIEESFPLLYISMSEVLFHLYELIIIPHSSFLINSR